MEVDVHHNSFLCLLCTSIAKVPPAVMPRTSVAAIVCHTPPQNPRPKKERATRPCGPASGATAAGFGSRRRITSPMKRSPPPSNSRHPSCTSLSLSWPPLSLQGGLRAAHGAILFQVATRTHTHPHTHRPGNALQGSHTHTPTHAVGFLALLASPPCTRSLCRHRRVHWK